MISANAKVGINVLMQLCQRGLDGKRMPNEWQISVLVPIIAEKGNIRSCNAYMKEKLLEHPMKIAQKVPEKIQELVNVDAMQFDFIPGRKMTDALLVVRRMQMEYIV